ncbi:MAG: glycosyltransferase family 4 protein [Candidatus Shapirobacteria bacterium]
MKVLLISHCFPPAQDGGAVTFGYIKEILIRAGNQVEVITSNCFSSDDFIKIGTKTISPQKQEKKNLSIIRLSVFKKGRLFFRLGELVFKNNLISLFKRGPVFTSLKYILKKREVDWVITGFFPTLAPFWGYWIARRSRTKLALIPGYHKGDLNYQNRYLVKLLFRADLLICFTKWEAKHYQNLGISKKKITVIGNVAPKYLLKKTASFPKKPIILYLGAKAAHKRVELLIEAMERVWQVDKKVDLVIAGPETLHSAKVKEKIRKLKISFRKQVTYYSCVSEKKKIALLDDATVLVNPALSESFSLVFMDSWARKKPVIGSNFPAKRELVKESGGGLLFKKYSAQDLAEKIIKIISSPQKAKIMGERGYNNLINKYTLGRVGEKLLKALAKE